MTSSIVDDGVMENSAAINGGAMENSEGVDGGAMENPSDKDMMRVMLGEIDRLRERVRILEHIDKGNQSAIMAMTKAAAKVHEDGKIALIAYQYAVIKEREECARLVEERRDACLGMGVVTEALGRTAELIRRRT